MAQGLWFSAARDSAKFDQGQHVRRRQIQVGGLQSATLDKNNSLYKRLVTLLNL